MGLFNQPIHCANCGRYLTTVRYFADEQREYDDKYCRRPACVEAEENANGSAPAASSDLAEKTKAELYDVAIELDIDGRSSMNKAELVAAIAEANE